MAWNIDDGDRHKKGLTKAQKIKLFNTANSVLENIGNDDLFRNLEKDSLFLREEFLKGKLSKMHRRILKAVPRLKKEGIAVGDLKLIANHIANKYARIFNGRNRLQVRRAIKAEAMMAARDRYGKQEKEEQSVLVRTVGGVIEAFVLLVIILKVISFT